MGKKITRELMNFRGSSDCGVNIWRETECGEEVISDDVANSK